MGAAILLCTFGALSGKRMRCMLFIGFVSVVLTARSQSSPQTGTLYPEKLRDDVEFLRTAIHRVHPDPYRYITRVALDRMLDSLRDGLRVPLDRSEFLLHLLPAVHALKDAHVQLDLPEEQMGRLLMDTPVMPLRVKLLSGGLYVEEELKGFRSLPIGAHITAINGRPTDDIVAAIARHVPVDGENVTLRQRTIERDLPWLYRRHVEATTEFKVRFVDGEGREATQVIFAMTGSEMARTQKGWGPDLAAWRAYWDAESEAEWVTMRTLDLDVLESDGVQPERFLAAVLKECRRNKARTLVLDLRGADGRDLAAAELVFAAVAVQPFRVVQGMSVRTPEVDLPPLSGIPADHLEAISMQFVPGANRTSNLRADDPRLQPLTPQKKAFAGKLYVVCDGGTRDAPAALVMMAKRSGRARVVGEEVGTNASSFTGGREFRALLPTSGLELRIPLVRYVPDGMPGGPLAHGERPHHTVEQQAGGIPQGGDTVREALLEMIRELR